MVIKITLLQGGPVAHFLKFIEKMVKYKTLDFYMNRKFFYLQVTTILKPGGKFISITFAQPHFRKPMYACDKYNWDVNLSTFGNSFHFFYYVMEKGKQLSEKDRKNEEERQKKKEERTSEENFFLEYDDKEEFILNIDL